LDSETKRRKRLNILERDNWDVQVDKEKLETMNQKWPMAEVENGNGFRKEYYQQS
jgi:hypothetical protein